MALRWVCISGSDTNKSMCTLNALKLYRWMYLNHHVMCLHQSELHANKKLIIIINHRTVCCILAISTNITHRNLRNCTRFAIYWYSFHSSYSSSSSCKISSTCKQVRIQCYIITFVHVSKNKHIYIYFDVIFEKTRNMIFLVLFNSFV